MHVYGKQVIPPYMDLGTVPGEFTVLCVQWINGRQMHSDQYYALRGAHECVREEGELVELDNGATD